jgi:predicted LPLAT superfamily acyltransferase
MIGGLSAGSSVRHARFEDFADKLQAPATLRAAQVGAAVPATNVLLLSTYCHIA